MINPGNQAPDWVIPHGQIVNLYLHGALVSNEDDIKVHFQTAKHSTIIQKETRVSLGEPAETILPLATRSALRQFLQQHGIATPKFTLSLLHENNQSIYEIWFNLDIASFTSEDQFEKCMYGIGWFLPSHYSYANLEDNDEGNMFAI